MLYISLLVANYAILKALELYKNLMAIMTKGGFDIAWLVNVNETDLFYSCRNIALYLNVCVV